jgi:hypothetical protein
MLEEKTKMRKHNKTFLACLLSLLLTTPGALAQQKPEYRGGELLIKFKSGTSAQAASISHTRPGAQVAKHFRKTGIQVVKLRAGLTTKDAIELYKNDPNVEYVEPNYKLYGLDLFPNDVRFGDLWGLHNTGQTGFTFDADIDAPEAWQFTTGSDKVVVAVIDSGVDYSHEDLSENMWVNVAERDGTPGEDDDANGYVDDVYGIDAVNGDADPMDDNGHGTHCSGTIGAVGNNGIGVVGLNWNVKIMALKFLNFEGIGYTSWAVECLEYAIMMKEDYGQDVRVISNSWGGGNFSQSLYDMIYEAEKADMLFVAAAGNDYMNNDQYPFYPSSYDRPSIVAVAATDFHDDLMYIGSPSIPGSNWGPNSVDVAAPGRIILSCEPGNSYWYRSGTSMATPHVSGLAALILAQDPGYNWGQVKSSILLTVDPLAGLDGLIYTGGRINAESALAWDASFHDKIAVIREKSDGKQRLFIFNAPPGPDTDSGDPIAYDFSFGHRDSNANNIAMAAVDTDGDGIDEIAVIRQKPNGKQRLFIFNAPPGPDTDSGDPIAYDFSFGHRDSNANNIAMAGLDTDGDGIDEIAVIQEKTDAKHRLFIFDTPQGPDTDTGGPKAFDFTFGSRLSHGNNIAMAGIR